MPPFDDFVNNISRCDQLQDDPAGPDLLAEMLCLSLVLYLERSIACAIGKLHFIIIIIIIIIFNRIYSHLLQGNLGCRGYFST